MWLSNTSIKRPVTTLTVMAAVEIPVVSVTTVLRGASPEVIDNDITDVLEEQIKTISGVKNLVSQSFEGYSQIVVEFELEKNIDVASEEVRAKVNLAEMNLPRDAEKPIIAKFDIAALPILWITVYGDVEYRKLAYYADKVVKEQLQSVMGVGNVQMSGFREREIRIWLDPSQLKARSLTAQDVVGAIQNKHLEMPGGRIETTVQEYSVKVEGEYATVDGLSNLVIAERGGVITTIKDVGQVVDGSEDLRSIARFNGIPTVGLGVRKQSGFNTVAVADATRKKVEEMKKQVPPGIHVETAFDDSVYIKDSIKGVQFDILFGILLTAVIMFLFLRNLRPTFISVISIPISLIGGFILMDALGFTVNFITMLAMSLSVGMVIDDTIVVMENIFRHVEEGSDKIEAARYGTDEVALAVIAATSTIAAVFLPVAFMKGIIGRFFFQFAFTVAMTIIISALVALTLTPFLSSRILYHRKAQSRFYNTLEKFFKGLENSYKKRLEWAVNHRLIIIALAIGVFILAIAIVPFIGSEFATQADEGRLLVRFEMPTGTSVQQTDIRLKQLEKILFSQSEVTSAFSMIGMETGEVNKGMIFVNLSNRKLRLASQQDVIKRLRVIYKQYNDMIIGVERMESVGSNERNADVQIVIQGPSVEQLAKISDQVVKDAKAQKGFVNVNTDLRLTKPDVEVQINRALANDLGVDVSAISNEIYILFGGLEVSKFKEGGYRYKIRVKALPDFRVSPSDLNRIMVRASNGRLIEAANLISFNVGEGPNVINRFNRRRSVTIFANVDGIPAGEGITRMQNIVAKYLPKEGNWNSELTGMSQIFQESFQYLLIALLTSILIIYMVLAIQFESFVHPFTILLSLPLAMVGAFGALLITGKTLNIFSFIGIIMLMGIVTKNAILLIDFANQARARGMDKVQAMLQAGAIRLRPILMTAVATAMGVAPVALALSEGGEMRAPMAIAVIGGVLTNTFLTLTVIPVIYLILDDGTEWLKKKMKRDKA
jgi:hydrophobe/amphiphile efflux-1 (HAE1) family protein